MSRLNLSWPISILAGFAIFIALLLLGSLGQEAVAQDTNCTPYPGCYRTAVAANKTASAVAKTSQAGTEVARTTLAQQGTCVRANEEQYPCPDEQATETPSGSDNNGGNNGNTNTGQQPAPTSTFTPTATRTPTATTSAQPDEAGQPATPTSIRATSAPADGGAGEGPPTPTPVLPTGVTTLACTPGETVELAGEAEPNTPLLLFFGERPVGGGVSGAGGAYRLRLQVGNERPGLYLVEVRERTGRALVDQFGCEVPAFTPTPTLLP